MRGQCERNTTTIVDVYEPGAATTGKTRCKNRPTVRPWERSQKTHTSSTAGERAAGAHHRHQRLVGEGGTGAAVLGPAPRLRRGVAPVGGPAAAGQGSPPPRAGGVRPHHRPLPPHRAGVERAGPPPVLKLLRRAPLHAPLARLPRALAERVGVVFAAAVVVVDKLRLVGFLQRAALDAHVRAAPVGALQRSAAVPRKAEDVATIRKYGGNGHLLPVPAACLVGTALFFAAVRAVFLASTPAGPPPRIAGMGCMVVAVLWVHQRQPQEATCGGEQQRCREWEDTVSRSNVKVAPMTATHGSASGSLATVGPTARLVALPG